MTSARTTALDSTSAHHRAVHTRWHIRPKRKLTVSRRSRLGLYVSNFFLAELVGVLLPLLNDFLLAHKWRYDRIGLATALAGLGLLVAQIPAGICLDRTHRYRRILLGAALAVGISFGLMPFLTQQPLLLDSLLFITGVGQAFIMPLLGTLALALAGHAGVNKLMGSSQAARAAGNVTASLLVMGLVGEFGTESAFYAITVISVFAGMAIFIIRRDELHEDQALPERARWAELLRDSRVRRLVSCSALFHMANAAITPMVAMYARQEGAPSGFVTKLVFAAQLTMVAAAAIAGRLGDRLGRKPVMLVAFIALPLRIALYAVITNPTFFLAVALFDGLAVGTYNVLIASMCADIDGDRGRFNTLMGLVFTTLALGGVVSPLIGGYITQIWGFIPAFGFFAAIAVVGAVLFATTMPETLVDDA